MKFSQQLLNSWWLSFAFLHHVVARWMLLQNAGTLAYYMAQKPTSRPWTFLLVQMDQQVVCNKLSSILRKHFIGNYYSFPLLQCMYTHSWRDREREKKLVLSLVVAPMYYKYFSALQAVVATGTSKWSRCHTESPFRSLTCITDLQEVIICNRNHPLHGKHPEMGNKEEGEHDK